MDILYIPASITIENGSSIKKYKWKSKEKESIYRILCKRAVIRFTCKKFAEKINKMQREKRQVSIDFVKLNEAKVRRIKNRGVSVQGYVGKHPYIQIIINKTLPKELWKNLEKSNKKSLSFPITINISLKDWKDIKLSPEDFLLEIEKEAKSLTKNALKKGFKILNVPKGRSHDVSLIHPKGHEIIIAISSHTAKSKSRSKEKTIQKILMDISKMLPYLEKNKKTLPIVITKPIKFENSWSLTTHKYLEFYEKKFGFKFLTTEFKKDWEDNIIKELLKI